MLLWSDFNGVINWNWSVQKARPVKHPRSSVAAGHDEGSLQSVERLASRINETEAKYDTGVKPRMIELNLGNGVQIKSLGINHEV